MTQMINNSVIPTLGFGTWKLEGKNCSELVAAAINEGYLHIDTAAMYENEKEVGEGIRKSEIKRENVFLTTKIWPSEIEEGKFQKKTEECLGKLAVEYVDLLLIHWPPKHNDMELCAKLLNEAADNGWTKHIGVSNFTIAQLKKITEISKRKIVCNQIENHPFINQTQMRQVCEELEVALIAYCPLYRGPELLENEVIQSISNQTSYTTAQIVLAWHFAHKGAGAIPKTGTIERLSENLASLDVTLSTEHKELIDSLMERNSRLCDFEFSPEWDAL